MKKHTMADEATIIGYLETYEAYCKHKNEYELILADRNFSGDIDDFHTVY